MGKRKDFITGICGMVFSAVLFGLSVEIGMKENTTIGADFMPKIVAVAMFILFAMVTYYGYRQMKSGEEEKKPDYKPNYPGVAIIFAGMILYAALLKTVGFILTSLVFLLFAIVMMTKKEEMKPVKYIIITVIAVLFIYFVFTGIFGIRLPKGILNI